MSTVLKIRDEYFGTAKSDDPPAFDLRLMSADTTPAEIIRQRVEDEVDAVNAARLAEYEQANAIIRKNFDAHYSNRSFLIATEPGSPEETLNTAAPRSKPRAKLRKPPEMLDAEPEIERALEAFRANRIVMLFDDRQVDGLDTPLIVLPTTEVTFLHLSPLKGG